MIYFDSSALVKKYVHEAGSERVFDLLKGVTMPVTSILAWPEILSGFARKRREKGISEKDYRQAMDMFEAEWESFVIVEFQDELLPVMKLLAQKHALKGADLVHLSSVLWLQKAVREKMILVASDVQLLRTAKAEKIEVINPEQP
jgi:predicted nucleic acid-binding protein